MKNRADLKKPDEEATPKEELADEKNIIINNNGLKLLNEDKSIV